MKNTLSIKFNFGFTLIELMVALVLGLILTAGVVQVFVGNKQTYRVTEAHSRLQDNARFAMEVLSRDIRSAGYSGCRTIENMNVVTIADEPVTTAMSTNSIITGSEAVSSSSWSPVLDASVALGTVVGGTDVITLQRAVGCGGTLVGNIGSSNANIQILAPNVCNVSAGDVLMISDCEDAHIFRATNVSSGTGKETIAHASSSNGANHFCKSYPSLPHTGACITGEAKLYGYDSELLSFTAVTYFIRLGTNGAPALWQYNHNVVASGTNPTELIEGIEDMQITYGIDDNDDNILDRTATANTIDAAGDWDKVVSAQVSLLTQTLDGNLTTTNQTVSFNGGTVTGTEGRIRRAFTSTVVVRNRVQ